MTPLEKANAMFACYNCKHGMLCRVRYALSQLNNKQCWTNNNDQYALMCKFFERRKKESK